MGTPNIRGTPLILGVSPLISGVSPLILGVTPNKNFGFWSKKLFGKLKKIGFSRKKQLEMAELCSFCHLDPYRKKFYLTILSLVGTPNIRGTPLILGVHP